MKFKPTILLTALLGGLLNFATLSAHAADGAPLWTNLFNQAGSSQDDGKVLAVDASGNVYVTGNSALVAFINDDYATIKYSSSGVPLWTNFFNYANDEDKPYSLALDGSGNVYVGGTSFGGGHSNSDYATIKYSSSGVPLWTNRFDGGTFDWAFANSLVVDGSGNAYVTGQSSRDTIGSYYDYATIKYSSSGVPLWTNRFNSSTGDVAQARALAVDGGGNVYVTGNSTGPSGNNDYATIKYSPMGAPLWTNYFNGAGNNYDYPVALAVDGGGNAYVTGYSSDSGGGNWAYATVKYSTIGVPGWTNYFNGVGDFRDEPSALAVDGSGNVYVTGTSYTNSTGGGYATIKYSSSGIPVWTNRLDGEGAPTSLAVDAAGNAYVTGSGCATIKYSCAGLPLWTNGFSAMGGKGLVRGTSRSLALDPGGSVYITGSSFNNFLTIKYTSSVDAPTIATQPLSQTATGSGGTFTVLASGTPPFTYQWYLNGTNISGANGPSYTLPNPTAADVGLYTVEICNAASCITSAPATLGLMSLDIHPVLNLQAPIGTAYRIDYSEDLGAPTNWYILTNLTLPTSPYLFVDPTPSHQTQRFYRAIQQ